MTTTRGRATTVALRNLREDPQRAPCRDRAMLGFLLSGLLRTGDVPERRSVEGAAIKAPALTLESLLTSPKAWATPTFSALTEKVWTCKVCGAPMWRQSDKICAKCDVKGKTRKREWMRKKRREDPVFRERQKASAAKARAERPEHVRKINRKSRAKHLDKARARTRENMRKTALAQFGLTLEDERRILEQQGQACSICKQTFDKTPCLDHCHTTGRFRALLCGFCNTLIGLAREDVKILRNAIVYLDVA